MAVDLAGDMGETKEVKNTEREASDFLKIYISL
jgi:hypothetical protein